MDLLVGLSGELTLTESDLLSGSRRPTRPDVLRTLANTRRIGTIRIYFMGPLKLRCTAKESKTNYATPRRIREHQSALSLLLVLKIRNISCAKTAATLPLGALYGLFVASILRMMRG
jgi:hypothetical protein